MMGEGLTVYLRSVTGAEEACYFLARGPHGKYLGIVGDALGFEGGQPSGSVPAPPGRTWEATPILCPLTAANAAELRRRLAWLRPRPLGLARSVGCGDRLGLATPGHVRAVRSVGGFAPIFAQQSMRENARTGRTPQQVMDDAMWGVFQEGWRDPWGADADHLKTTTDVDLCVAAGYSLYTVDPGDHVDNEAHGAPLEALRAKVQALPWSGLEASPEELCRRYLGRAWAAGSLVLEFDEPGLFRAAAKYGRAIAHTVHMARHLAGRRQADPSGEQAPGFELEVSVDETETPTSPLEHFFVASELKRLGVHFVSLAPRYSGRFEKGVDYIGDLDAFDAEMAQHAAIARALGPYKLSIHSGSDKFSVYPAFARHAGTLVHLKTAGTSYLEALRAIAGADPSMFRKILDFARGRYGRDRATYHVSADVERVPLPDALADDRLAGVLDSFDGREVLHVTFGSVLEQYGERLLCELDRHEEAYYDALEAHFIRHLLPFGQ